ncbi:CSG1 [Mytilus edulis]|uniref:CSG1 n=1 Tax=Mytilus edulis TaxID=6550 RepID=A0A8S3SV96_MYTED|nr:CSG1 [Mytilus edulis]
MIVTAKEMSALCACGTVLIILCIIHVIPSLRNNDQSQLKEECRETDLRKRDDISQIPRHIHQIYFDINKDGQAHLQKYQFAQQTWAKLCPDFKYTLWNQSMVDDLIKKYYPGIFKLYSNLPAWISKINVGKFTIIHHYGGIYADNDIECLQNVKSLLQNVYNQNQQAVFKSGDNFDRFAIDFFAATANHPLLEHVIAGLPYAKRKYLLPYLNNMLTTGTAYFNIRFKSFENKCAVSALPYNNEYIVHHRASSWHSWDVDTKADVLFILDMSGSVGKKNFQTVKNTAANIASLFTISKTHTQVGVDVFSSNVKTEIKLKSLNLIQLLKHFIKQIPYVGGGTKTYDALDHARKSSFTKKNGK